MFPNYTKSGSYSLQELLRHPQQSKRLHSPEFYDINVKVYDIPNYIPYNVIAVYIKHYPENAILFKWDAMH